jgi:hypothetical protein
VFGKPVMNAAGDIRAVLASVGYEDVSDETPPRGAILGFVLDIFFSLSI